MMAHKEPEPFPAGDASPEHLLAWLQTELKKRTAGAARVVGLMDEDRSGTVRFEEFALGLKATGIPDISRAQGMRLFKAMDTMLETGRGDNCLTIVDFEHLMSASFSSAPPAAEFDAFASYGRGIDGADGSGSGDDGVGGTVIRAPEVLENPGGSRVRVGDNYVGAQPRRPGPSQAQKQGRSPLQSRSNAARRRRQQRTAARPSALAAGGVVGALGGKFPPQFWKDLETKLPTGQDAVERKARMDMFSDFDPNGNGYVGETASGER